MLATIFWDGRFRAHFLARNMFYVVCDISSQAQHASMARHHAEDMGQILYVPSSFSVVMSTTGVPHTKLRERLCDAG